MKSTKEFNIALGEQLRICRKEKGLPLWQVADHIGATRQQLGRYEEGLALIPTDRFVKASQFLGKHPATLIARAL